MAQISNLSFRSNYLPPIRDKQIYLPSFRKLQKEKDFVLNCDSQEWKLSNYNSLYDNHLKYFFSNPKVRNVLVKNGVVDENGNVYRDKSEYGKFAGGTKKFSVRHKLPPISENPNLAIQRIVLPYRSKKSVKVIPKITKNYSAPEKRIKTEGDTKIAPYKKQSFTIKPTLLKPLFHNDPTKRVKPLTKDELELVFAKYEVKPIQKVKSIPEYELIAEERSTDYKDSKSDEESPPEEKIEKDEEENDFHEANKKLDFDNHLQENVIAQEEVLESAKENGHQEVISGISDRRGRMGNNEQKEYIEPIENPDRISQDEEKYYEEQNDFSKSEGDQVELLQRQREFEDEGDYGFVNFDHSRDD